MTLQELTHENIELTSENKRLTNTVIEQAVEMMKLVNMLSKPVMFLEHGGCMAEEYTEPQDRKVKALEKELARNMKLWDEVYEAQLLKIGSLQKEQDRIKTELLTLQFETEKKERAYQHCITGLKLRLMEKENIPWGAIV